MIARMAAITAIAVHPATGRSNLGSSQALHSLTALLRGLRVRPLSGAVIQAMGLDWTAMAMESGASKRLKGKSKRLKGKSRKPLAYELGAQLAR